MNELTDCSKDHSLLEQQEKSSIQVPSHLYRINHAFSSLDTIRSCGGSALHPH